MATATNYERSNACDQMAYMRGRDDARAGLERFPRAFHPDQYGAYNAGWRDWHKLAAFPAMLAAMRFALPVLRSQTGQPINLSEIADFESIIDRACAANGESGN